MKTSSLLLLVCLLMHVQLNGQFSSTPTVLFEGGDPGTEESIHFVNLDNDGLDDVILCGQNGLGIYQGVAGVETFKRVHKLRDSLQNSTERALAIHAFDLNTDGAEDILAVRSLGAGYHIVWYENQGAPSFLAPIQSLAGMVDPVAEVVFGDLSGNGLPDVLIRHANSSDYLLWALSITAGVPSLGAPVTLSTGMNAADIQEAELINFDESGGLDVVVGASNGVIKWFESLGGSSFAAPVNALTGANGLSDMAFVDLDGDMDLDLLIARTTANAVVWHERLTPQGSYGTVQLVEQVSKPLHFYLGDIDGDLDQDIWMYTYAADNIFRRFVIYKNTGSGTPVKVTPSFTHYIGPYNTHVGTRLQPGDLFRDKDGDGDLDLLVYNDFVSGVGWIDNLDGTGLNLGVRPELVDFFGREFQYADLADIDGDGRLDVAASVVNYHDNTTDESQFFVATQEFGPGQFRIHLSSGDFYNRDYERIHHNRVKFADFDGDGDLDVAAAYGDFITVSEYFSGTNTFVPHYLLSRDNGIDFVDMDLDGRLDILGHSKNSNKSFWFKAISSNPMTFDIGEVFTANRECETFGADMNNDGDMDVVVRYGNNGDPMHIAWLEQVTPPGLVWLEETDVSRNLGFMELVDFDGDTDLDIVAYRRTVYGSSGTQPPEIVWIENLNPGFSGN
ncbi:MAG: VCBS repeat-containing protein, partial [Phaeodactylibacter sp.]|nr:VCBS repeat-containing protein [Phaeodactylibacter sp.]